MVKWLQVEREELLSVINFDSNICCLLSVCRYIMKILNTKRDLLLKLYTKRDLLLKLNTKRDLLLKFYYSYQMSVNYTVPAAVKLKPMHWQTIH